MSELEVARLIQDIDTVMLGKRVRTARIAAGLRQRDIAGEEWTAAYISRIEAGQRRPSLEVLERLAERMNVTPGSLLRQHGNNTWIVREVVETTLEWTVEAREAAEAMEKRHTTTPTSIEEGNSHLQAIRVAPDA